MKRTKVVTECGLDEVAFLDARGLHVLLKQVFVSCEIGAEICVDLVIFFDLKDKSRLT